MEIFIECFIMFAGNLCRNCRWEVHMLIVGENLMKGAIHVSDSSPKPQIPNTIIDLLVNDIFQKNGINIKNAKEKLTTEQKQMLKELVKDLSQQVDMFTNPPATEKKPDSK
jgi:spore coat protein W